jgi:hypothetical protein
MMMNISDLKYFIASNLSTPLSDAIKLSALLLTILAIILCSEGSHLTHAARRLRRDSVTLTELSSMSAEEKIINLAENSPKFCDPLIDIFRGGEVALLTQVQGEIKRKARILVANHFFLIYISFPPYP